MNYKKIKFTYIMFFIQATFFVAGTSCAFERKEADKAISEEKDKQKMTDKAVSEKIVEPEVVKEDELLSDLVPPSTDLVVQAWEASSKK